MRIFYASDNSPNPFMGLDSNIWRNNLLLPMIALGHDVVEFDYDLTETFQKLDDLQPEIKAFIDENRPKVTNALIDQLKVAHRKKPLDLFFSYFYDSCILPEAIDEIESMGITTVNWYCNGLNMLRYVSEISPHYDWCLVPEKDRLQDYLDMGARPIYCQEAANPDFYKPYDVPVEFEVTFVGQAYGERPDFVRYLLDRGIDMRVWGPRWKEHASEGKVPVDRVSGPLPDIELVKLYSRSKINIGFSSVWQPVDTGERILQVRLRDFEVPMSGGFYMVEYIKELEDFYRIGEEIVCYSSKEDLGDKIDYYLEHEDERNRIRKAGHMRCLRDHTWQKRLEISFEKMGLPGSRKRGLFSRLKR